VAYLRLFRMGRADEIDELMRRWPDARGLVLDLRGNGGGSRDAVREFVPYLLDEEDSPLAVNVAARRLAEDEACPPAAGCLENRDLHPITAERWGEAERARAEEVLEDFEPEWRPPAEEFSPWHVMLVDRATNPEAYRFSAPVVVLLDAGCFSATDIFLSALAQLPQVTLVGAPSSGGSARSFGLQLAHSGLEVRLASMASFRPDGRLLDGRGVQPDVLVEPAPADLLEQGGDAQLDAALRVLAERAR
jgi:C-terminal processing protease CtpA/Prc